MTEKIGLYWFRKDLRLQQNESLACLKKKCDRIVFIYLRKDNDDPFSSIYDLSDAEISGPKKRRFVDEALLDLQRNLRKVKQELFVLSSEQPSLNTMPHSSDTYGVDIISHIVKVLNIDYIASEWHCGVNEINQWQSVCQNLAKSHPELEYISKNSGLLYEQSDFPFSIENLPQNFSPFRKKVEKYCSVKYVEQQPDEQQSMPALPALPDDFTRLTFYRLEEQAGFEHEQGSGKLIGGETAALSQLHYYLWESDCISRYKETRNGLDGWDFSSKLSAWLAHGCTSARTIDKELKRYESQRTKNESTYWLFFELLWREYFHWNMFVHKSRLFYFGGVQDKRPSTTFSEATITSWIQGETGYKIVDACMKQLKETGFMSNRGRQLVASCFVHELNQDWRYGAAYFEYQLIDFDVASNFGNWQYLAGVGADPRGHRQFNLEKQTQTYDPNMHFIDKYLR
ncbi:DASH family cryptochrome [Glaciecola sp. MH2013]|uniref:DASH family cryptochrome n=1 Tax=Glaciecola sp. MH2013 TaxID=2785524 RepID=UPI00189DD4D1|nr:DASH family cryptochrome [Glaciecola sp. MH2013]MBF7072806.1 DASH family cryptochrome [Glaciecola sp. MH2013]